MSYKPTEWHNGDIVSEERMNKLEQGVENAYLYFLDVEDDNGSLSTTVTWQEVADIVDAGRYVILRCIYSTESPYSVWFSPLIWITDDNEEYNHAPTVVFADTMMAADTKDSALHTAIA